MKKIIAFFTVIYLILSLNPIGLAETENGFIDDRSGEWQTTASLKKETSLNGIWKYEPDPKNAGMNNNYFKSDIDFSNWKSMKVPGNWAVENPDMFSYYGKVWYKQRFDVAEDMLKSRIIRLKFKGVDYIAKVWLNDHYLGGHEGYFNPFDFEIERYLKPESNILAVCVDSPREKDFGKKRLVKGVLINHDCRPPGNDGNTGGIWNDVKLIGTGWIYIESALAKTELNEDLSEAKINFECLVNNLSSSEKEATFKISFKGGNFSSDTTYLKKSVYIQPGESNVTLSTSIKNPNLWWTWDHGKPNLYEAGIFIETEGSVSDTEDVVFGIRQVAFDRTSSFFYLNGKRMFQRGTNYIATQWFSTMDKEDFERDVQMMVDANLNTVRIHAHVAPQEFYTVCDEKGMLVWADFALIWGCAEDETFIREASNQFKEYIAGYRNHPSIWLWCAHNGGADNRKLNLSLYEAGREIDRERVISENSGIGARPYHGWYGNGYEDYLKERSKFVTEFGAQGIPVTFKDFIPEESRWPPDKNIWQYHNSQFDIQQKWIGESKVYNSADEFSEMSLKYQYDVIKFAAEQFRRIKYKPTGGAYQFMFTECWPSITWAVIDNYRNPKPAYYALKEAMSPVLVSVAWEKRFFNPGDTVKVSIWCINDYFYLIKNCGLSYDITNPDSGIPYLRDKKTLSLEADSTKKTADIEFIIPLSAKRGDIFKLSVKLNDSEGRALSANRFIFRIKEEDKYVRDLSGKWLFKKGDGPSYSDTAFNDTDWSEIKVPAEWEEETGNYNGFAWYRKHINIIKEWNDKDIKLFVDNIDDSDEIYFNGEKIGGSGELPPHYITANNQNRIYAVPKRLIRLGEDNVIAVRVYDFAGSGGIVSGPVEIGDISRKYIPLYLEYPEMKTRRHLVLR